MDIEELEIKKDKLQEEIERIDREMEKLKEVGNTIKFNKIFLQYKDFLLNADKTFRNLIEIKNKMKQYKKGNETCVECKYMDLEQVITDKICPFAPICCFFRESSDLDYVPELFDLLKEE